MSELIPLASSEPSAEHQMSSSGLELATIETTPTTVASARRLRYRLSCESQFTEHRPASVHSTNEATGLLADPNPEADQPGPSTNASAPTYPPTNSRVSINLEINDRSHTWTVFQSCLGKLLVTFKRSPELFDYRTGKGMLHCLLALFILSIVIGITVFNCFMHFGVPTIFTPGVTRKGFADPPNTRGTFNIVTACFSTILTCVYRSLHLDVPYPRKEEVAEGEGDLEEPSDEEHGQQPRWRRWVKKAAGWAKKAAKKVVTKLWIRMQSMKQRAVWVGFNIVAPELVAVVSAIEFLSARMWRKKMVVWFREEHSIDISSKWTLAHQHMAGMGGFKVPSTEGCYVILRSRIDVFTWARSNPEAFISYANPRAFKSIDFKQLGMDIDGLSKADGLLKAITVIQASWLVVQTLERVSKGLPVTELEVTTCAYVACAIFTYACWWDKPYGVQNHIILHVDPTPRPDWRRDTNPTPFNRAFFLDTDTAESLELPAVVLSGIIGAIVGAIHSTLWNAQFMNTNGQLLWRVCCITQIVAPILMSVFLAIPGLRGRGVNSPWHVKWDNRFLLFALIPCFFQFCERIVIFILIGYSFWSQPADVYRVADWSWSWFPHIS